MRDGLVVVAFDKSTPLLAKLHSSSDLVDIEIVGCTVDDNGGVCGETVHFLYKSCALQGTEWSSRTESLAFSYASLSVEYRSSGAQPVSSGDVSGYPAGCGPDETDVEQALRKTYVGHVTIVK